MCWDSMTLATALVMTAAISQLPVRVRSVPFGQPTKGIVPEWIPLPPER
jgi:hypothetical protein